MTPEDRAIHLRNAQRSGEVYWRYFDSTPAKPHIIALHPWKRTMLSQEAVDAPESPRTDQRQDLGR